MYDLHSRLEWMADSDEPLLFEGCESTSIPGVLLKAETVSGVMRFSCETEGAEQVIFEQRVSGGVKNVMSEFLGNRLKILFEVDSSWLFKLGRCRTCIEGIFDFDLNLLESSTRVLS